MSPRRPLPPIKGQVALLDPLPMGYGERIIVEQNELEVGPKTDISTRMHFLGEAVTNLADISKRTGFLKHVNNEKGGFEEAEERYGDATPKVISNVEKARDRDALELKEIFAKGSGLQDMLKAYPDKKDEIQEMYRQMFGNFILNFGGSGKEITKNREKLRSSFIKNQNARREIAKSRSQAS